MKSIFFGANGYLGRHMIDALRQKDGEVVNPLAPDGTRLDLTHPETLANIDWNVDAV